MSTGSPREGESRGAEERREEREVRMSGSVFELMPWASCGIDVEEDYGFVGAVGAVDDATGRSKWR